MKTWKFFLLIVLLAVVTFLMIKSVEQHYHAGQQDQIILPVAQK
jgi:hypothetical protein